MVRLGKRTLVWGGAVFFAVEWEALEEVYGVRNKREDQPYLVKPCHKETRNISDHRPGKGELSGRLRICISVQHKFVGEWTTLVPTPVQKVNVDRFSRQFFRELRGWRGTQYPVSATFDTTQKSARKK